MLLFQFTISNAIFRNVLKYVDGNMAYDSVSCCAVSLTFNLVEGYV